MLARGLGQTRDGELLPIAIARDCVGGSIVGSEQMRQRDRYGLNGVKVGLVRTLHDAVGGQHLPGDTRHFGRAEAHERQRIRAGEANWGVDPDDGYFVPMSPSQDERFLQNLRDRERLVTHTGAAPAERPSGPSLDNAAFRQLDPQLAAAWQALAHRLEQGQFQATGRTLGELRTYVSERELAVRRGELVSKLEAVSKELRELDAKIGEAPQ